MFQHSNRLTPVLINILSKNQACQPSQVVRAITQLPASCRTNVNNDEQRLRCPNLATKPIHGGVVGCRHLATTSKEKPYKPLLKAKDFERVNPTDRYGGLDPSMPLAGYEESEQLADANDMVKRMFSLELANTRQIAAKQIDVLRNEVQLDPDVENKWATLIVRQTVMIRNYSKRLLSGNKKDMMTKIKLLELVDKRRQTLKRLRKQNYEQFEKVKKVLDIDWIPAGRYDYYPTTKRIAMKEAVLKEAWSQRMEALEEYMAERRDKQLVEMAQLKQDLGEELTEEEKELLRRSEEIET